MSVGSRLREERERYGFSQETLALSGGVSKRSQIDYEQDKIEMKAGYLAGIADAGIDVGYVITGQRSDPGKLNQRETLVVDVFRRLDKFAQDALLVVFERLAATNQVMKAEKGKARPAAKER